MFLLCLFSCEGKLPVNSVGFVLSDLFGSSFYEFMSSKMSHSTEKFTQIHYASFEQQKILHKHTTNSISALKTVNKQQIQITTAQNNNQESTVILKLCKINNIKTRFWFQTTFESITQTTASPPRVLISTKSATHGPLHHLTSSQLTHQPLLMEVSLLH